MFVLFIHGKEINAIKIIPYYVLFPQESLSLHLIEKVMQSLSQVEVTFRPIDVRNLLIC